MKNIINKGIHITKFDAAVRQLETATVLWFNNADPVSIHTLICAAYQILYDINKHQDVLFMMPDSPMIKPEKQREWKRRLKAASNFMKHAENDPVETLSFDPELNEFFLFDAIMSYTILTKETRPILQCFLTWLLNFRPEFFLPKYTQMLNNICPVDVLKNLDRASFFKIALPLVTSRIIPSHKIPRKNKKKC